MNAHTNEYNHSCRRATVYRAAARIAAILGLALLLPLASGCWNVVGHRLELSAPELLDAAIDAEHRGDGRAARTLLGRVAVEHDGTPEADIARALLAALPRQ